MEQVREKLATSFEALKDAFAISNKMASPTIKKVVISCGTGKKSRYDRHINDFVAERLATITGQKAQAAPAKKSIAGFKIRTGDVVGQKVTLRGEQALDFVDKLIHIALPRTKDFRGIKRSGVDEMGNLTFGIKEHTIFPECSEEELKNIFSFAITITTTADNKALATAFLEHVGIPFEKVTEEK